MKQLLKSELAIFFEETSLNLGGDGLSMDFEIESSITLETKDSEETKIPTSLFENDSGLRGIVRYLHDEKKMSFGDIASSLKRHKNTIRTSYEKSRPLGKISGELLPVRIFERRAPLEAASLHLAKKGHKLKDIARILGRNPKTVWTALHRAGWRT